MENSCFQNRRSGAFRVWLGLAALAAVVALGLAGAASAGARPLIGKDGRIHACYRVKGKPKGSLRAVKGAKTHCRRGERRVSWVAAGATGAGGSPGSPGQPGGQGANGTAATGALETRVADLTNRVEALEKTLAGVTNSQLLGALADVNALCAQDTVLTTQVNSLRNSLGATTLGGLLLVSLEALVPLPAALPSFSCP